MDISTRVQQLTIEKRMLLALQLKKELGSQSIIPGKFSSATNVNISPETIEHHIPRLIHDREIEAFSTSKKNHDNRQWLVAYLVLTEIHTPKNRSTDSNDPSESRTMDDVKEKDQENDFVRSELRHVLRKRLPDFMIPSVFVTLEQLPRTATGKVDYRALPNPLISTVSLKKHSDAPATVTQERLQAIWVSVLGMNEVGIRQNFFALGGHSLLIAQVVSHIRSTLGVDIPLRSIFDYPTIEALGDAIDTLIWTKTNRVHSSQDTSSDREKFEI